VFTLYDADTGPPMAAGLLTKAGVAVSNSLFTVVLDVGPGVFNGDARWLAVSVKPSGASRYTPLTPRQPLTPTTYAVLPRSGLSGNVNETFSGTMSLNPLSGTPFAVGNSTKVVNLNADLLDGRHSTAFWKLAGNAGTTAAVSFHHPPAIGEQADSVKGVVLGLTVDRRQDLIAVFDSLRPMHGFGLRFGRFLCQECVG
jgi:hypothetical protein